MGIVVQKFGGTSVGSADRLHKVAEIIEKSRESCLPVIVVSALSGTVKTAGTTSMLLKASELATAGEDFEPQLLAISKSHKAVVFDALTDPSLRQEAVAHIENEIDKLKQVLAALSVIHEASPKAMDLVIGVGERLSALLLSAVLRQHKIPAQYVDLSQAIDFPCSEITQPNLAPIKTRLAELCRPNENLVPIATGFFGSLPQGILSAVGRGYSDFTAALIAAGFGAPDALELQVWKEVDGIFSADPRKIQDARVLQKISANEAAELTYFGSEVLHPFTMETVMSAGVPVRVKNTFKPELIGTLISREANSGPNRITAVTAKRGISIFTIKSNRMYNAYGFLGRVFDVFKRHAIAVDLVSTSEVSVSCSIEQLADMQRALPEFQELGDCSLVPGKAILAVVGEGIGHHRDSAAILFQALAAEKIQIEMITQASTQINISCVISEQDLERALKAVHSAYYQ